jgi:hypothetical protein
VTTKHTPGPWTIDEALPSKIEPEDEYVAVCDIDQGEPGSVIAWSHPLNASIIAAAPDLLAACEAMLQVMREGRDGGGIYHDRPEWWGKLDAVMEQGNRTVAKAKGGAA